jgi:protein ImuB
MGESRIGAPALVDTYDERAVGMGVFKVQDGDRVKGKGQRAKVPCDLPLPSALCPLPCLRRFRLPITARVVVEHHTPVRVIPSARGLAGGNVIACAGPWRTSGRWWALDRTAWDRDVWDVELADGGVYRLARHRATGGWEIEGVVD